MPHRRFSVSVLGRGRPSRSQVFTLELFPGGGQPIQNSEDRADSRLETRIGLKSSTGPSWDSVLDGSVVDNLPSLCRRSNVFYQKTGTTAGNVLQGTLDMLILRTLLYGPAHGHQIGKHIQRTTNDFLQMQHGSLYPALHRLERRGWVISKWETAAGPQSGIQVLPIDRQRQKATGG